MKISLCMIVKNEEANLGKCLYSVADYVDEIVIIDTGSTDLTKEVAKKYTDKIFDFVWCDDFAKARNYSLAKATNDWVLILDADEVVLEFEKQRVCDFIRSDEMTVGRIKRINPFQGEKEDKRYMEHVNRLFNKKYYCYEGTIHEQVVAKNGMQYNMRAIEIEVEHIGWIRYVYSLPPKKQKFYIVAIINSTT